MAGVEISVKPFVVRWECPSSSGSIEVKVQEFEREDVAVRFARTIDADPVTVSCDLYRYPGRGKASVIVHGWRVDADRSEMSLGTAERMKQLRADLEAKRVAAKLAAEEAKKAKAAGDAGGKGS